MKESRRIRRMKESRRIRRMNESKGFNSFADQAKIRYQCFVTQTVYFHLQFLCKSDLRISCILEAIGKITEINLFDSENRRFSQIFD